MFANGAATVTTMVPTDDTGLILAINRDLLEAINKIKADSLPPHRSIIKACDL